MTWPGLSRYPIISLPIKHQDSLLKTHTGEAAPVYLFNISNSNLLLEKQRLLTTLFHSSIKSSLLSNINLTLL